MNMPEKHRRSIRLKEYDYAQPGGYFITIVTHQRECLFGEIVNGEMRLNDLGKAAKKQWEKLAARFPSVELGAFVVMPTMFTVSSLSVTVGARRRIEIK